MHNIDWSDLQYVLAVARTGSLAAAARALGVSHSTVLRRLERFEEAHGARLFARHRSGYRLLPEHGALASDLAEVAAQTDRIMRRLSGTEAGFAGEVRLTTTDSLAVGVMGRHMARFRSAFPDVVPRLTVTNNRLDLGRMDADIVVRPAPRLADGFVGRQVAELGFRVYGAVEDLAGKGPVRPGDHPWIGPDGVLGRSPIGTWMAREVPQGNIVQSVDSFVVMARLVARGIGLAMLPCCLGDTDRALRRVAGIDDRLVTGVWVAAHADRAAVPRIAAFLAHLQESLAEDAPLLGGH